MNLNFVTLRKISKKILKRVSTEKIYSNYNDALKNCTYDAYQGSDLVKLVVEKTKRFKGQLVKNTELSTTSVLTLTSALYVLAHQKKNELRIIDFGGAAGAHYFQVRPHLPPGVKICWAVVETNAMVNAAKILENDELRFFDTVEAAKAWLKECDLVNSSGTLQYTPDPYLFAQKLVDIHAPYLLLTRLNLTEGNQDIVVIQKSMLSWNGIGPMPLGFADREVQYPNFIAKRAVFEALIQKKYSITLTFDDQSGVHAINGHSTIGFGMLCSRMS